MRPDQTSRGLPLALLASILIHLGIGLWFAIERHATPLYAGTPPLSQMPEDQYRKISLGDPDRSSMSLAWIGLDEMRPFDAPESEVDQAQFTPDPSMAGRLAQMQPLLQALAEAREIGESTRQAMTEAVQSARRVTGALAELFEAAATIAASETLPPPAETPKPEEVTVRDREETQTPAEKPTETAETGGSTSPSPQEGATGDAGEAGQADDREAPAAAINPVRVRDLGGPVEAQGLRIDTVRPFFHDITRLTASTQSPIFRLHFTREGRVRQVETIESSGRRDVDEAILNALFRWRARGEALNRISSESPEATIAIDIRILL